MKIALIIYSLDPGGAERVLSLLANYWEEKKNEVTIIPFSGNQPFYPLNPKIQIRPLNSGKVSRGLLKGLFSNIYRVFELRKNLKEIKPNIVIAFMTPTNILALFAAKSLCLPIIISERTNINHPLGFHWKLFRRIFYAYANALVVLSNYDKGKYTNVKRLQIIYNPIVIPKSNNEIKKENIVLGVGRIDHLKGFDFLIRSFAMAQNNSWRLIIVGDGPNRKELEILVDKLEISQHVTFVGVTKNVFEYYQRASIFVLSSRLEGFPNVLCEAMASGIACLSFDCKTGPREIITNEYNGILVEPENIQKMSEQLTRLMQNPDLRKYLGDNARGLKERLSLNYIMQQWDNLISSIAFCYVDGKSN